MAYQEILVLNSTTPQIVSPQTAGAAVLTFDTTGGPSTVGPMLKIGTGSTTQVGLMIGYNQNGYGAIYPGNITPSTANYAMLVDATGALTRINSNTGAVALCIGGSEYLRMTTTALNLQFGIMDIGSAALGLKRVYFDYTNSATIGAVTINKAVGRCNVAAAATSVVVTNSLVTAASEVLCVIAQNDGTATLKNVVAAAGSFTVTLTAAATANCAVAFYVLPTDA